MRIKLKYTKSYHVIESGDVHVDVEEGATLADVYRKAYDGDFAEFLPRNKVESGTEIDFNYIQPEATHGEP